MNISKKDFINKYIIFNLILGISFFYLIPLDIWKAVKLISIINLIMLVINFKFILKSKGEFNLAVVLFLLISIFEVIIGKLKFNQEIKEVVYVWLNYLPILLYLIINSYRDYIKKSVIEKYFIILSFFLSIIMIVQIYLYENHGIQILTISYENQRFEELRITNGCYLVIIATIIIVSKIINKKERDNKNFYKYIFILAIYLIYFLYVVKTRSIILYLFISIILMAFFKFRNILSKFTGIAIILVCGLLVSNLAIFQKYIDLNTDEKEKWSVEVRYGAIDYYVDQFTNEPILGTGYINEKKSNKEINRYLHGPNNQYYKDDVGIIGFISTFGALGLFVYLYILVKSIQIVMYKKRRNINIIQEVGFISFLVVSSVSIIIFDPQRIIYLPFVLFLIES